MKGLFILAGESFREGRQLTRVRDTEFGLQEQELASRSHVDFFKGLTDDVDCVIHTYTTRYADRLREWYGPYLKELRQKDGLVGIENLQMEVLSDYLDKGYDYIFLLRIDLILKQPAFGAAAHCRWPTITFSQICWLKGNWTMDGHPRIADLVCFIPSKYFPFIQDHFSLRHESWSIYRSKGLSDRDMDVMINTYHDSDSNKDWNPLYRVAGRKETTVWYSRGHTFTHPG